MGYANEIVKTKEDSVVTLPQAKAHLNVDEDFKDDDQLILQQIASATSITEDFTGRDVAPTLNTQEFIDFCGSEVIFQEAPFSEMVSITKYDDEGNAALIESTEYTVRIKRTEFIVIFKDSVESSKVVFEFMTGYDNETIPMSLLAAVLIKTNDLYDMDRTSSTVGVNQRDTKAFDRCISGYIINRW